MTTRETPGEERMKHTSGPWYVSTSPDYFPRGATVIRAQAPDAGRVVAVLTKGPDRDTNARLIAAAPAMYSEIKADMEDLNTIIDHIISGYSEIAANVARQMQSRKGALLARIEGR